MKKWVLGISIVLLAGCTKPRPPHQPAALVNNVNYFGGPIISKPTVYAVYWGDLIDPDVKADLPDFYRSFVEGGALDWLSEYSTVNVSSITEQEGTSQAFQKGSFGGELYIRPINKNWRVTNTEIRSEIEAQMVAGNLPVADENTIYMIHMAPEMTVVFDTVKSGKEPTVSCVDFCAFHSAYKRPSDGYAYYAVLMDQSQSGCVDTCGPGDALDRTTVSVSHEMIETITDPLQDDGVAWFWPGKDEGRGEIADLCEGEPPARIMGQLGRSYAIQSGWSKKRGRCYP